MAHPKRFYVYTDTTGKRAGGEATVTWNPSIGEYDVVARTERNVLHGTVYFNEAGFRGRQWEIRCDGIGDNQCGTLRAAAQTILAKSREHTETRKLAESLRVQS